MIGADALTRTLDWSDRTTCVLFGDGAGAVVLECATAARGGGGAAPPAPGLVAFRLHSAGSDALALPIITSASAAAGPDGSAAAPSAKAMAMAPPTTLAGEAGGRYGALTMRGSEVYDFATGDVPRAIAAVLEDAGWRAGDVDWLVLHQANSRILEVIIIPNEGTLIIIVVVVIVIVVIIRLQRG